MNERTMEVFLRLKDSQNRRETAVMENKDTTPNAKRTIGSSLPPGNRHNHRFVILSTLRGSVCCDERRLAFIRENERRIPGFVASSSSSSAGVSAKCVTPPHEIW
jgi:hypothetical protein